MLLGLEYTMKQYLKKYQNPEKTFRDITRLLDSYKGLTCRLEPFVFIDGRSADLVNLQGTIPVTYKAFVNGQSKNLVNLSGTIPVTYAGVTYNMPVCIWVMDTHPNNAPMCYVKPTSEMRIKISKFVDHNGKIYLPYLHEWAPASSDLLGLIQVMICTFGEYPPMYSKPRTENPPPYPQQASYMPMPGVSSYSPYPATSFHHSPSPTPYPIYPQNSLMYPPYQQQQQQQQTPAAQSNSGGTITEAHIRASLISAVNHKLSLRLEEQFGQSKAELEILVQSANELNKGKDKLDNILEKLKREKMELERNITILKEKDIELEKAIEQLDEQKEIDVDEAVTTTAPLYKQILNAYAEEAATEDAIYYMGEALRRGVIDLDVFLKQVRSLSRKQFMLRALMQKCRQKAGLAG